MTRSIKNLCIALLFIAGLLATSLPARAATTVISASIKPKKSCAKPSRSTAKTARRPQAP